MSKQYPRALTATLYTYDLTAEQLRALENAGCLSGARVVRPNRHYPIAVDGHSLRIFTGTRPKAARAVAMASVVDVQVGSVRMPLGRSKSVRLTIEAGAERHELDLCLGGARFLLPTAASAETRDEFLRWCRQVSGRNCAG